MPCRLAIAQHLYRNRPYAFYKRLGNHYIRSRSPINAKSISGLIEGISKQCFNIFCGPIYILNMYHGVNLPPQIAINANAYVHSMNQKKNSDALLSLKSATRIKQKIITMNAITNTVAVILIASILVSYNSICDALSDFLNR